MPVKAQSPFPDVIIGFLKARVALSTAVKAAYRLQQVCHRRYHAAQEIALLHDQVRRIHLRVVKSDRGRDPKLGLDVRANKVGALLLPQPGL